VKTIVGDLVPQFETATGHKVTVSFGEAGELRHRILEGGEAFDLAFLPSAVLGDLATRGKIARDTMVDSARTEVGMGVRAGATKPDTSSTEAFKRSLLAMRSIVITDPATGGVSGVHYASVLQRLGIADEIKPKLRLTRGVLNAEFVGRGEADLLGDGFLRFVHEDDRAAMAQAQTSGKPQQLVFRMRDAAGEWRHLEAQLTDLRLDRHVRGVLHQTRHRQLEDRCLTARAAASPSLCR